jgi:RHS repeat-associated protein
VNRTDTANGLNQLAAVNGTPLTYDANGNLTSEPVTGRSYGYDSENKLLSSTLGSATTWLIYDSLGNLTGLDGAASRRFVNDGSEMVAETDTSGAIQWRVVRGDGPDEVIAEYWGSGTSSRHFDHLDQRGSVIAATDASGSINWINSYDEYGVPGASNGGRFQYTGQVWLGEAGVYHYKARAYKPELGRFLQTDPIGHGGGPNLYAYVGNDPVNLVDPLGLQKVADIVIVGPRLKVAEPWSFTFQLSDIFKQALSGHSANSASPGESNDGAIYVIGNRKGRHSTGLWSDFIAGVRTRVCTALGGPHGKGTVQLGLATAGTAGGKALTAGAGIAMDRSGNVAGYAYGGRGFGSGTSGVAGPSLQESNAKFVTDLKGWFAQGSASLGDGLGGTVDVFTGSSSHGPVAGGGLTGGPGAGESIFAGPTFTVETPSINVYDAISSAVGC